MKHILSQLFAVIFAFTGASLFADERAPINTVPKDALKDFPVSKSLFADPTPTKSASKPESKPDTQPETSEAPAKPKTEKVRLGPRRQVEPELRDDEVHPSLTSMNRLGELRVGTRFASLFGDITPIGGTKLDFRDDLQLKETSAGVAVDVEGQISEATHLGLSFTQNTFNAKASIPRLTTYNGIFATRRASVQLPAGSQITTKIDMATVAGAIRYDLVKNDTVTFSSLCGFKVVFLDQEATVSSANSSGINGGTFNDHADRVGGTPLAGFDLRVQLGRHVYTGISASGFGWDHYTYAAAQGYVGVDFSKRWGLRLGVDADFVQAKSSASETYDTNAIVPAGYLQLVMGF